MGVQAFKSGPPNSDTLAALEEASQKTFGLTPEQAQKILKGVASQTASAALAVRL